MLASHENYGWTLRSLSFEFLFSGLKSAKRRNFKRVFFPDFSFFKVNQAVMYLLTFAILYIALFFQFLRIICTPKLRFSESRFSEILGLVNKSQLP